MERFHCALSGNDFRHGQRFAIKVLLLHRTGLRLLVRNGHHANPVNNRGAIPINDGQGCFGPVGDGGILRQGVGKGSQDDHQAKKIKRRRRFWIYDFGFFDFAQNKFWILNF